MRKHGGTLAEVVERAQKLKDELHGLDNKDARLDELDLEIAERERTLVVLARELSAARLKSAKKFDQSVVREVGDMNLEGAVFVSELRPRPASGEAMGVGDVTLGNDGMDEVEFLWSANRGEPTRPLVRIVSGGELSRLMLAVKRVLSSRDLVSLYVFDEVDSGLGGRAADAIGKKIQAVAKDHQAIAITHLAPIAARADHHICVRKETRGKRTVSQVVVLDKAGRTEELARMIDGAHITDATLKAARDMLSRPD